MKNIITEELGYMKYLLGYQRGIVISEQTAAVAAAVPNSTQQPAVAAAVPKANWRDVVKYYERDTDPNWFFNKKEKVEYDSEMHEKICIDSNNDEDTDTFMNFYDDGKVYINNKGQGTSYALAIWEWDGTKPLIKFKDITKNASGYVQPTDTDWSAITQNNKIIGLNAEGPLVKKVQQMLILMGYTGTTSGPITTDVAGCHDESDKCDGIYGTNTEKMVKQFQEDNGLSVDGIVGQQTYEALDF